MILNGCGTDYANSSLDSLRNELGESVVENLIVLMPAKLSGDIQIADFGILQKIPAKEVYSVPLKRRVTFLPFLGN